MAKQFIYIIIIPVLIAISCSNNDGKSDKALIEKKEITQNKQAYVKAEKLIITKVHKTGTRNWTFSEYENVLELTDTAIINNFEKLLRENTVRDYFNTIPEYSISYYYKNTNYNTYRVSVPDDYDTIYVFDDGFQFYYKILKKDWNNLLSESTQIISRQIELFNLKIAREVLEYCDKNNLPFILKPDYQNQWPFFDGQFKFSVSRVEKEFSESEILDNIKSKYPNDKYKIAYSGWSTTCGCPTCKDCLYEAAITIFFVIRHFTTNSIYIDQSHGMMSFMLTLKYWVKKKNLCK